MTRATRSRTGHLPKPARRDFLVNPGVGDDPFGLRQKRFRGAKRKIGKQKQVASDPDSDDESEQEFRMGPPRGIPAVLPPTMAPTKSQESLDLPAEDDASTSGQPSIASKKTSIKPAPYRKASLSGHCLKEALGFVVDESHPKYADDARRYWTLRVSTSLQTQVIDFIPHNRPLFEKRSTQSSTSKYLGICRRRWAKTKPSHL
jgi:hypothetical protein